MSLTSKILTISMKILTIRIFVLNVVTFSNLSTTFLYVSFHTRACILLEKLFTLTHCTHNTGLQCCGCSG